jgi:hypothetical protein
VLALSGCEVNNMKVTKTGSDGECGRIGYICSMNGVKTLVIIMGKCERMPLGRQCVYELMYYHVYSENS